MNSELENLMVRLHGNKSSLNIAKTISMLKAKRLIISNIITAGHLRGKDLRGLIKKKSSAKTYECTSIIS